MKKATKEAKNSSKLAWRAMTECDSLENSQRDYYC
jgi:hypothetical protein